VSSVPLLWVLGIALLRVLGLVAGGFMMLVRLGVIAYHTIKPEEPPGNGDYSLDQSRETGE
jgi:hypothetical protein